MPSPDAAPGPAPVELLITTSDRPSVTDRPSLTVCAVNGAIDDVGSVTRLEDGLRAAFQFRTDGAVILDLTNVPSLSPEAVNAVLGTAHVARRQRRRLMVYGVRTAAAQPSEVRRLHAALTVLPGPAGRRLSAVLLRPVLTDRPAIRGAASG